MLQDSSVAENFVVETSNEFSTTAASDLVNKDPVLRSLDKLNKINNLLKSNREGSSLTPNTLLKSGIDSISLDDKIAQSPSVLYSQQIYFIS
jgi:hypothetical protein